MYNSIVAILTWLAADPTQIDVIQPQAAACSRMAYSLAAREPVQEEEEEDTESEVQPEEGTPTAQVKTKRRVMRCVNGRCVITYE